MQVVKSVSSRYTCNVVPAMRSHSRITGRTPVKTTSVLALHWCHVYCVHVPCQATTTTTAEGADRRKRRAHIRLARSRPPFPLFGYLVPHLFEAENSQNHINSDSCQLSPNRGSSRICGLDTLFCHR
jgi:hypothetical protein